MKARRNVIILLLLVAIAGGLLAAQGPGCDLLGDGHHALKGCPVGILTVPFALALAALALASIAGPSLRGQFVLIPAYHPPRRPRAR